MVGQAHLLFGDVEFFEVEDHLLLQPVAVDVDLQLFEVFQQAGPDRLRAGLFERHDLLFVAFDLVHAAQQVGDQDRAFLQAERVELRHGGFGGGDQRRVFLVGDALRFGRYDLRQAHDGLQGSAVPSDPRIVELGVSRRVAQLLGIGGEYLFINTRRGLHGLRFDGHEDIDLAALYRAGDDIADFVFRLAVNGRKPQPEVELFGVERTDFDRDLLILQRGFALAEARHGFYHLRRMLSLGKSNKNNSKCRAFGTPSEISLNKFCTTVVFSGIFYLYLC